MKAMNATIRTKRYDIFLGNDSIHQLGDFLTKNIRHHESKKFILVDGNTRQYCLPLLLDAVPALQHAFLIEVEAGEKSKSIDTIVQVWNQLTHAGADRNSILVNLGGGVVTDIGGFAASTFMRGIDFINVPTTLLAMVDASAGGKNGINFGGFKNHVGTFDEPKAVFVSPLFLTTLPEAETRSGFAEVIKHALISGLPAWKSVMSTGRLPLDDWFSTIKESIGIKNKIVESDYRDRHFRKALNFGHTIGHALESYSQQHHAVPLKHGEAIAIGMIGELHLAVRVCNFDPVTANEIFGFIRKLFPFVPNFDSKSILQLMKGDKKNASHQIHFSLISAIGNPVINQQAGEDDILNALAFCKTHNVPVN